MSTADFQPFPKGALIAVGAMLALTLAATAAVRVVRLSQPPAAPVAQAAPVAAVQLGFDDEADGSVRVREAATGRVLAVLAPNTNGFIRGVVRGLARDRISRTIGPEAPFRLSLSHAGDLSLTDTATRRTINLEAFGVQNRAAFLSILKASGARA